MKALLILVLAFGLMGVRASQPLYAQEPADTVEQQGALILGERQERALASGAGHTWTLAAERDQYVEVAVEQQGVDVVVRVINPAAAPHREFDALTGPLGTECVRWVAGQGGTWHVYVAPLEEGTSGSYAITWSAYRAAEPADRQLTATDPLYYQASVLLSKGHFGQADTLYQQVLATREQIQGPDGLDVGEVLSDLGYIYLKQSRYDEAEVLLQRALPIYEATLGADHPNIWLLLSRLADLYWYRRQLPESEVFYERTLTIREQGLGAVHPDLVRTLLDQGWVYSAQDRFDEAEAPMQRALSIQEQAFGPDHTSVGNALNEIGIIYFNRGSYPEAGSMFERALAIQEQALGIAHPQLAALLNSLGMVYNEQGRYADAIPLYERALDILEQDADPSLYLAANLRDNLGTLYHWQGRYTEADSLFVRALDLAEQFFGPDHLSVAATLNNQALVFVDQGRYAEAEAHYQRSLEITEHAGGQEHPRYATTLDNLAKLYDGQGRLRDAEALYKRALDIRQQALDPDHREVATSLNNVGLLYVSQGRYAEAEPMLKRAIVINEQIYGPRHYNLAAALHNLASLYETQGWYADAEPLYRQALEIYEQAFGPHHESVATVLNGLASLYSAQSQYDEAESLHRRALTIREEAFGREHVETAHSLNNLSTVYLFQEEYDQARLLLEEALAIQEKIFGRNHPTVGNMLNNLAGIYLEQGRYEKAESLYQQGLAVFEGAGEAGSLSATHSLIGLAKVALMEERTDLTGAFDRINEAIDILDASTGYPDWRIAAYTVRARLYKQDGHPEEAINDLAEALRATEALRTQVGGGEKARAQFLTPYIRHFDRIIDWQLEVGDVEAAFEYAERGRTRVLVDQLAAGKIDLRASIPEDVRVPLEAREGEARTRLAEFQQRITLTRARTDLSTLDRLRQLSALEDSLRAADQAYQQVYEDVKNASPLWRDMITAGGQPTDLPTVQRQLVPRDGLLLLYHIGHEQSYVFAVPPRGQEAETFSLQMTEEQAAVLQVAAGPMTTSLLQESLGLEESGERKGLMKALASRREDATLTERLYALWSVLVPPALWTKLTGASEVVIVPDALLHYLPFEALVVQPGAAEAAQYWLDVGPVIRYAPSATALYNIDRRPAPRARPQANEATVLSLSNPIFSPAEVTATLAAAPVRVRGGEENAVPRATRDSYERAGGSLVRLPGTALETEAIQAAYGDEADTAVLVLQGLDASEPNLRAVLAGKRYLHFGTHGLVDERRGALFASLAVTPPAGEGAALENDGFLQLHEIYDLKLPENEMAVLSACESNIGPNIAGEGVFALSRGFLAAGARRVVASQWSVDDTSTAALMGAFFERVVAAERGGLRVDFARALWEARQQVRAEARWSAPYFWAPFVLTGKQ